MPPDGRLFENHQRFAAHPTLSEAIKEAGLVALRRPIHIPRRRRTAAPASYRAGGTQGSSEAHRGRLARVRGRGDPGEP